MNIPKNLGEIGFLRNYPEILEKLIKYSQESSLNPFIKKYNSGPRYGGFWWDESIEGEDFWEKILEKKDPEHFYTLYPKELKETLNPIL